MESAENARVPPGRIAFAEFVFDPQSGDLSNGVSRVRLRRQPAIVLCLLTERAGEVVTRREIRQAVWGSEIQVEFEQGINWCIREIRKALGDDPARPQFIETIAKQGYRFLQGCSSAERGQTTLPRRSLLSGWRVAAAAGLLAPIAIALAVFLPQRVVPTLLVLPLDNFTGSVRMDSLAAARTDYLIASLGSNPARLRVIDRPSANKLKSTGDCIIHIGQQLHASYVLVGSIDTSERGPRFSGGVFRVADNTQVWTRADVDPTNDAAMKQMSQAIASAIH